MISYIFVDVFLTLCCFLYLSLKKNSKKYSISIKLLLVIIFIQLISFFIGSLSASEYRYESVFYKDYENESIEEEMLSLLHLEYLSPEQTKEYKTKVKIHKKEGNRCFNEAKNLCKLIPNSSDKKKIEKIFQIAIETSAAALIGQWKGVMTVAIAHLGEWIVNYNNETNQMITYLKESGYHYEMCAFYQEVLDKE